MLRFTNNSNRVKLLIGFIVSAIFLYLAFRKVNIDQLISAFAIFNYWYLIPATLGLYISLWLRAYRWGIFFMPLKKMSMKNLFSALMVGYMGNNIFPFKLGELLRAYYIGKMERFSKTESFATIMLERVFDILTILIILGFALHLQPFPSYVRNSGLVMFLISLVIIIFLFFLVKKTDKAIYFYRKISHLLPQKFSSKGEHIIWSLIKGLSILRKTQYFLKIAITTIGIWSFYLLTIQMFIFAFNLEIQVPIFACVTVLIMSGISVSVPSSPGYIGTFHYLVMQSLILYKVSYAEALSFAVVFHLFNILPVTILGLFYFSRQQLNFQTLFSEKEISE